MTRPLLYYTLVASDPAANEATKLGDWFIAAMVSHWIVAGCTRLRTNHASHTFHWHAFTSFSLLLLDIDPNGPLNRKFSP
jgi:hypothetical protein